MASRFQHHEVVGMAEEDAYGDRDVTSVPATPHVIRVRKTKHREESTGFRRRAVPDPPGNQDAPAR